jgi:hypothetical protein
MEMAGNASMNQLIIKICLSSSFPLSIHGKRGMAVECHFLNKKIYEHFH